MYQNGEAFYSNPMTPMTPMMEGAYPTSLQNKSGGLRKWLVLGLIVVVVMVVITIVLAIIINTKPEAKLLIKVTPASANIEIDGQQYKNGLYTIEPDKTLTAVITKDGFKRQVFEINAEANKTVVLSTFLAGEDGDLSYYYNDGNYYDLYLLWEYFCEYTEIGRYWYLSEISKIQPQVEVASLEGEEKTLYNFLLGE